MADKIHPLDAPALARIHGPDLRPWSDGYTVHLDADGSGLMVIGYVPSPPPKLYAGTWQTRASGRTVHIRPDGEIWTSVRMDVTSGLPKVSSHSIETLDELQAEFDWTAGEARS